LLFTTHGPSAPTHSNTKQLKISKDARRAVDQLMNFAKSRRKQVEHLFRATWKLLERERQQQQQHRKVDDPQKFDDLREGGGRVFSLLPRYRSCCPRGFAHPSIPQPPRLGQNLVLRRQKNLPLTKYGHWFQPGRCRESELVDPLSSSSSVARLCRPQSNNRIRFCASTRPHARFFAYCLTPPPFF